MCRLGKDLLYEYVIYIIFKLYDQILKNLSLYKKCIFMIDRKS